MGDCRDILKKVPYDGISTSQPFPRHQPLALNAKPASLNCSEHVFEVCGSVSHALQEEEERRRKREEAFATHDGYILGLHRDNRNYHIIGLYWDTGKWSGN